MTREEKIIVLSQVLSPDKAYLEQAAFRINEKTDEQLDYILSPIDKCIYLEACAGSGKTEVLGIKAAYEISRWASQQSGLAVLSFTNELVSKLGMKNLSKGIRVEVLEGTVNVDVALNISYGYSIPEVSAKVQDRVKNAIENMTGLEVSVVNIRIASVDMGNNK